MATVYGTHNSETLNSADGVTSFADEIHAGEGDDIIYGLGGADDIFGGKHNDIIRGGSGDDPSTEAKDRTQRSTTIQFRRRRQPPLRPGSQSAQRKATSSN